MKLFSSKFFLFIETFYLIFLPLGLLRFFPHLYSFRTAVMFGSLIYIGLLMKLLKLRFQKVGFSSNISIGLQEIFLPTCAVAAILFLAGYAFPEVFRLKIVMQENQVFPRIFYLPFYVMVSVPLQEFIFHGFYLSRLEFVSKNKWFLILHSSIVFMLIHIPFGHPLMIFSTFLLSVALSHHFLKYRNIYVLMFVHAILGGIFIYQSLMV